MVQFLQPVQGFGDKLREALVGASGDVFGAVQKRRAQTELQKLFEAPQQHPQGQVGPGEAGPNQAPPMSPIEQIFSKPGGAGVGDIMNLRNKIERLSPGSGDTLLNYYVTQQKNQQTQQLAQQKAQQQQLANEQKQRNIDEAAERSERHHRENIEFKKGQEEEKIEKPLREKRERATNVINSAEKMRGLLKYTGSSYVPGTSSFLTKGPLPINREGIQKRAQFDATAAAAANFFRDLDTKGQLPQGLYEQVIKPNVPNSEKSERENEGLIDGLIDLAKEYGGLKVEAEVKSGEGATVKMLAPNGELVELTPEQARAAIKRNTGWKKE